MEHSEYRRGELVEGDLPQDPIQGMVVWLRDAEDAGAPEPTAMCIATATPDAAPSARFVLLRGLDARGLTFYTNYESRKGEELDANPQASAAFWWPTLERQIRVEGRVERVPSAESDAYFADRPSDSRFASAASPQSRQVSDRASLEDAVERLREAYPEGPPRPASWGGYRIVPERIEFWQGRPARLHDRFLYERTETGWRVSRLAP